MDGSSIRARALVYPIGPWLIMAVVAVLNGGFRELVIVPRTGEYLGHLISTVLLVAVVLVVSFLYFTRSPIDYTLLESAIVGVSWLALTVGFEFLVGYVEGTPVSATIAQYDVTAGQVWILVPLTLLVAPLYFGWYAAT